MNTSKTSLLWICAFALTLFGLKLWLIGTYATATPFWDEWDEAVRLYQPVLEGHYDWSRLFAPHNEHRIFTTRLFDLALLQLCGSWNPLLQMILNAGFHLVVILVVVLLVIPIADTGRLALVLALAFVLFAVPHDWESALWGFESQFYFVLLFGAPALWFLVEAEPLSGAWLGGLGLCVLSYLSAASGMFVPAAAGIAGVAVYALGIRRGHRQLIAAGICFYLFILDFTLTPVVPGHYQALRATSVAQFFHALVQIESWPLAPAVLAVLARNAPLAAFCAWMAVRRPAGRGYVFLLALGVFGFVQACSLAYGRASFPLSSRYMDFFAVDVLVQILCLAVLVREAGAWRPAWIQGSAAIWAATVLGALLLQAGGPLPGQLAHKRQTGIAQETNVRNFLFSGDVAYLRDKKPPEEIPYPHAPRLAAIASADTVKAILPFTLREPLEPMAVRGLRDGFVSKGYSPSTPQRHEAAYGNYGVPSHTVPHRVALDFDSPQDGMLGTPIAGHPLLGGTQLALEQGGERRALRLERDPGDGWLLALAPVAKGPFRIVATTGGDPSSWVAIAAPVVLDRHETFTLRLLSLHGVFITAGIALLAWAVYRTPRRTTARA